MEIRINRAEFDQFKKLQVKEHGYCHAAFSTNLSENTWPFETFGFTPEQLRKEIRKRSPKLDQIVGLFIELPDKHPKGGRFFIDFRGAYWKDRDKKVHRFVEWIPDEPLRPPKPTKNETYAEFRARTASNRAKS
ncbi:MAG: hypothetical protein ABSC48_17625 [Terracidiphilus sp.]|jgi:hypothetical protein